MTMSNIFCHHGKCDFMDLVENEHKELVDVRDALRCDSYR